MKKVIYTQRVEVVEQYQERRDCTDQRVANFIVACDCLPIPVPNKSELAEEIMFNLHPSGILLTGGNSLVLYGGNAPERDAMDRTLIKLAIKYSIPVYGFCRGMQSILEYFGNRLVEIEGHIALKHLVREECETYEVNSYHKQACLELKQGCGLSIIAQTSDGVIEAIHHKKLPIIGTMWHPEREEPFVQRDIDRVKKLFHLERAGVILE